MSERLTVHDKEGNSIYDIVIEQNFDRLSDELEKLGLESRRVCIVTETNVDPLYGQEVYEIINNMAKKTIKFVFVAGEANKNLYTVKVIYSAYRGAFRQKGYLDSTWWRCCGRPHRLYCGHIS